MGGAKCSYRNCTIRSNGVTHMFHYPVFDKIRCHQWLTNAQRHDFLNLKVSQLKNRVVCQHHFQPDNFMNFKMDKLKFDAVPTVNGPFCNAQDLEIDDDKALPIAPDEIENDFVLCSEKKANFSVKYGDFLTNSDGIPIIQKSTSLKLVNFFKESDDVDEEDKKIQSKHKTSLKEPLKKNKIHIISEKKMSTPVSLTGTLKPVTPNSIIKPRDRKTDNVENMEVMFRSPIGNLGNTPPVTNSEIFNPQIFDPQILVDPQDVLLEQSSIALPPIAESYEPNKILVQNQITNQQNIADNSQSMYMITLESNNVHKETTALKSNNDDIKRISNQSQSTKSLLKNKIPPERIAAIEEKRQFNKKLRDMIEFCLDDSPKKPINQNTQNTESEKRENSQNTAKVNKEEKKKAIVERRVSQYADKQGNLKGEKVSSFLSKDTSLPSCNDYNMASLEARLKKMEDNLLLKITQNSKHILDLKNVLQAPAVAKHTIGTQTKENEDTIKKQLFQEISKYLTPEASSVVYEELFLNQLEPIKYSRKRKLRQPK